MAGGRLSGLTRLRGTAQRLRDGDLAGAAFELARTALIVKVGLPVLAVLATLLIIVVAIAGAVAKVGNAAAQACDLGGQGTPVSLSTSPASPVGPPAPPADVPIFQAAAAHFGLGAQGPSILAAINEVETTFDTSTLPGVHSGANSAGAEGAMQFLPGTWAKYGMVAPGGANPASPYDETDAVWSAANYLHASGAPGDWQTAIFAYNHAGWYVDEVLRDAGAMYKSGQAASGTTDVAEQCASAEGVPTQSTPGQTAQILPGGTAAVPQGAPPAVQLAIAAGNELIDKPYLYGGAHNQPLTQLASAYDCSSSTSFVLHGAGVFGNWPEDSTQLESYGKPGAGKWITVYANSGHAFIAVAGIVLDTAWYAPVQPTNPNSGPRWQPASIIGAQYTDPYGGFVQRHPEGL
jgi:Transglycosylase SLT domain